MNRAQKRNYEKSLRRDSEAEICPKCKKKSKFLAYQDEKSLKTNVACVLCLNILAYDMNIATPKDYVCLNNIEKHNFTSKG